MIPRRLIDRLRVRPGTRARLGARDTNGLDTPELRALGKEDLKQRARAFVEKTSAELSDAQERLWANDVWAVLVVLQAMDAGGKDGMIEHVMSRMNPQGCRVVSFKQPSAEELDHDFLWRCVKELPRRGQFGIFNRSYYEEVLVVRVHPELLAAERLPPGPRGAAFWRARFQSINAFERHLVRSGTVVVKLYLHISPEEQRRRFLARIADPKKHWKFSLRDVEERRWWDEYQRAYEETLTHTSTTWAPWYVVPADHKWVARAIVAEVLTHTVRGLDLAYPKLGPAARRDLQAAKRLLAGE